MKDLSNVSIPALDGTVLQDSAVAYPCGLIAKYFFNDTYMLAFSAGNKSRIYIDETNIAHSVDKEYKFKLP